MISSHGLRASLKPTLIYPQYTTFSLSEAASGTSLTINTPAGAVAGDLLVVFVLGSISATWTAPAGWFFSATNARYVGWIIYDGVASNYIFTTTISAILAGAIICIKNGKFDVLGATSTATATNPIAPSITIGADRALLFGVPSLTNSNAASYTPPTGWTELVEPITNGSFAIHRFNTYRNAGATGTVTFPGAGSASSRSLMFSVVPKVPTVSYITALDNIADQTTYTYTAASIGTASAGRYVVIGVSGASGTTATRTVTSLTIGGVSATAIQNPLTSIATSLFGLTVAAGTTADIVVTFSAAVVYSKIYIYTVTGLNSTTPIDSDSASASGVTSISLTLTTQPNAAIISICSGGNETTSITGWTNLTQNQSSVIDGRTASAASGIASGTIIDTVVTTQTAGFSRQTAVVLR